MTLSGNDNPQLALNPKRSDVTLPVPLFARCPNACLEDLSRGRCSSRVGVPGRRVSLQDCSPGGTESFGFATLESPPRARCFCAQVQISRKRSPWLTGMPNNGNFGGTMRHLHSLAAAGSFGRFKIVNHTFRKSFLSWSLFNKRRDPFLKSGGVRHAQARCLGTRDQHGEPVSVSSIWMSEPHFTGKANVRD